MRKRADPGTAGNYVAGRVAYDYDFADMSGAFDSPFDFNRKMLTQRALIQQFYQLTATEQVQVNAGVTINIDMIAGGQKSKAALAAWASTRAPLDYWRNYRFAAGVDLQPYIPSLGLLRHIPIYGEQEVSINDNVSNQALPAPYSTGKSAGVDCVGFVLRARCYENNTYYKNDGHDPVDDSAEQGNPLTWEQEFGSGPARTSYWTDGNSRWVLTSRAQYNAANTDTGLAAFQQACGYIVPGDIFYYDGHVGIISDVGDPLGDQDEIATNIKLIESVYYYRSAFVLFRTIRNLSWLVNASDEEKFDRDWFIGRLK